MIPEVFVLVLDPLDEDVAVLVAVFVAVTVDAGDVSTPGKVVLPVPQGFVASH